MDDISKQQIGQRIKQKREERGLSQTELAKSVGKSSAAYIALIEAGQRNVSAIDLMLIAKNLGTGVSDLIGESISKQPEVMQALRADKNLSPADRKKVEEYYTLLKNQHENR